MYVRKYSENRVDRDFRIRFFQLFTLMFEIKLTVIIYDELNFKNQELISNILYVQIHIFQTKI